MPDMTILLFSMQPTTVRLVLSPVKVWVVKARLPVRVNLLPVEIVS